MTLTKSPVCGWRLKRIPTPSCGGVGAAAVSWSTCVLITVPSRARGYFETRRRVHVKRVPCSLRRYEPDQVNGSADSPHSQRLLALPGGRADGSHTEFTCLLRTS